MEYIKTYLLEAAIERYTALGWDLLLSQACLAQDDALIPMLLVVDLRYKIARATKNRVIDITPSLKMDWVMREDGKIEPIKQKGTSHDEQRVCTTGEVH